jgi:hypothetical protein
MAVGFPMPFEFPYDVDEECAHFDEFFVERGIPDKGADEIDLASWNIANLGLQPRRSGELRLIAHILSHFDIVAVQEVNENLAHFNEVMEHLDPLGFDMTITDKAGSSERLAVVYRTDRLRPRQLFGELDYNPSGTIEDGRYVVKPRKQSFTHQGQKREMFFYNFNRNPHLSTWEVLGTGTTFCSPTCTSTTATTRAAIRRATTTASPRCTSSPTGPASSKSSPIPTTCTRPTYCSSAT